MKVKEDSVRKIPSSVMWAIVLVMECFYYCFTFGTKQPRFTRAKLKYMTIHRYFDITKAKTRLGYAPKVSIQEGIQRTVKWYLEMSKVEKKETEPFRKLI